VEEGSILVSLTLCQPLSPFADNFARPKEFVKVSAYQEDSDEHESTVGKMPPSDESDTEI
jgi:hypothetical protein